MILQIKINNKIYKSTVHRYVSLHRALINVFPYYTPKDYTIYANNKVYSHTQIVDEIDKKSVIEVMPKMRGGLEMSKSSMGSGMFYFILFLITLSPIYFMYVGIVPLKSFLSRRILTTALQPFGKYLVCVLGKKTLYSRILLATSIIKYFIFIFAVFVTFTLPFIILCILMGVFMKHNTLNDSPSKLKGPVNAGSTTGMIFTVIHMLIYFGYRWFDYVADFLISLCNKSYYTKMMFVPILESMKLTFNNVKGIGAITATFGFAADVKGLTAAIGGLINPLENVMHMIVKNGCEAVGVDEIEESFKKNLKKINEHELKKFEIKGRDRKKFCFDFNEYLDENEFEELCKASGNEQCCTSTMFYKIAEGLYQALTKGGTFIELVKKGLAMVGLTGHLITANIAFFEESMERDDAFDDKSGDAIFLTESQIMIKSNMGRDKSKERSSGMLVYEDDVDTKIEEYRAKGFKVQALYDDKYRDEKQNIIGLLNIKRKVSFDEMKNKINELKRMLNDYNASYDDDDLVVKYVFKPYFITNICEALNGVRAVRDFSKDINGLDNAVDILRSGMFTGRWMIVFYLITYLVLVILGFFKVYLK